MTGRDERGRFAPGNSGGGRKRREDEDEIKRALDAALPLPDVLAKFVRAVQRGESWAIALWLAYRWGKPKESVDVTTNGESVNFSIQAVDYRTGMDALAPGPVGDSNAPGQDEGSDSGTSVG